VIRTDIEVALLEPKEYIRRVSADHTPASEMHALRYTRWLANHHYENFHVVSLLLPKRLHQDFYNVYAYCRWADDLGDEIGDREESLRLLAWWRGELEAMYTGSASHPVFVALKRTVERHAIPIEPFDRLIRAFEQDQLVGRYRTMNDVFDYCTSSANPVGHLVLRRDFFDFFDQAGAIDAGHDEISEHEIDAAEAEGFKSGLAVVTGHDAVAAGFKHDFTDGKRLLVIVDAKDCFLGLHGPNRGTFATTFF
jgi:hypothetical protein